MACSICKYSYLVPVFRCFGVRPTGGVTGGDGRVQPFSPRAVVSSLFRSAGVSALVLSLVMGLAAPSHALSDRFDRFDTSASFGSSKWGAISAYSQDNDPDDNSDDNSGDDSGDDQDTDTDGDADDPTDGSTDDSAGDSTGDDSSNSDQDLGQDSGDGAGAAEQNAAPVANSSNDQADAVDTSNRPYQGPILDVPVGLAQHPDYSRIVFIRPSPIPYTVTQNGGLLEVRLNGGIRFDFGALLSAPLQNIGNPRAAILRAVSIAQFDVPFDSTHRVVESGNLLIINITPGASSQPVLARTPPPVDADGAVTFDPDQAGAGSAGGAGGNTLQPRPADTGRPATETVTPIEKLGEDQSVINQRLRGLTGNLSDGVLRTQVEDLPPEQLGGVQDTGVQDVEARNRGPQAPIEISGQDGGEQGRPEIGVDVAAINDGIAMIFRWREDVGIAAFERAGILWLVFDRAYRFNPEGIRRAEKQAGLRIASIDLVEHSDALILRIKPRSPQNVVVEKSEANWIVSLKDTPARPRFPITPDREDAGALGQQIVVRAGGIGRKITVRDPLVGDEITVFPLLQEGRGLPRDYLYAVASLPETSQGVVVVPEQDDVDVERYSDRVAISTGEAIFQSIGLTLRPDQGDFASQRLIDFKAWRGGDKLGYQRRVKELQYRLSVAEERDIQSNRWNLARFYLASGRATDAIGVLEIMLGENGRLARDPGYLIVSGVSKFKLGRLQEARVDLTHSSLVNEQDADLWRTLVFEALGEYPEALDYYRRGKDVIGTYDVGDRAMIQSAVIRAALRLGELDLAGRELELMGGLDLDVADSENMMLMQARLLQQRGDVDEALILLDQLALSTDHAIAAQARLSRTLQALDDGTIDPASAVNELETLRYVWRGDGVEITAMDRLAELYTQLGDYERSLNIYREGMSFLPREARRRRFSRRQEQLFQDLYLGGKADELPPLDAIALWFRHRELTPLGENGHRMVRNLANRLVAIELLDDAAELLEYQITENLEGNARANVAVNLASIYIRNEQPERALTVLRATRSPDLLEDIETTRRHVESRALVELSRYEEAEQLLANDLSADAERLRADLYWGWNRWDKVVEINRRLLGDGWRRDEPLDDLQRVQLIRMTIAMTNLRDQGGLVEARERYGRRMRNGNFAIAFEQLTSNQELTGKELGEIATQIASTKRLTNFLESYQTDFEDDSE